MPGDLEGYSAVVTGAASGLGEAAARRFAREGARVVVSDISEEGAEKVARSINADGGKALGVRCDVALAADCVGLVSASERFFDAAIDVCLANAGVGFAGRFADATPEQIARVVAVNVTGSIFTAQAALRSMVKSTRGSLLFTCSLQGVLARPQRSLYTASKHAIVGLVKSLAIEYGPLGVRVNAIAPAATDTPFLRRQLETAAGAPIDFASATRRAAAALPLGHLPTPEDFADAAVYLASKRSRSVTGHNLLLDAGAAAGIFDPRAHEVEPSPKAR